MISLLKESVLNDDVLHRPSEGKVFKGNYIAIIEYYTFLNHWVNKKNLRRFKSEKSLNNFLRKNYNEY
jgi:hypothetical protein